MTFLTISHFNVKLDAVESMSHEVLRNVVQIFLRAFFA